MEVTEEEKDELLDRLADDILSSKSLESDSKSEGEEPQVQEPIENIQQDQEIRAEIDAE